MKTYYAKITVKDTAPCFDACIAALRGDVEITEIHLATDKEIDNQFPLGSGKDLAFTAIKTAKRLGAKWYKSEIEKQ